MTEEGLDLGPPLTGGRQNFYDFDFADVVQELVRLHPESMGELVEPKKKSNGPWSTSKIRTTQPRTRTKLAWTPQMKEALESVEDRLKKLPPTKKLSFRPLAERRIGPTLFMGIQHRGSM